MTESPHTLPLRTSWQILGALVLPIGSDADGVLRIWLTGLLAPLCLHTDFLTKVLSSAQKSTARAMRPNAGMTFGQVHFSIFAPDPPSRKGKTWGFFLIERSDGRQQEDPPDYAVEIYLYPEG